MSSEHMLYVTIPKLEYRIVLVQDVDDNHLFNPVFVNYIMHGMFRKIIIVQSYLPMLKKIVKNGQKLKAS